MQVSDPGVAQGGAGGSACASVSTETQGEVRVSPEDATAVASRVENPQVRQVVETLRTEVSQKCLTLTDARGVVAAALADVDHLPIVPVDDPAADCARVDLTVGGSILVTVRGPER